MVDEEHTKWLQEFDTSVAHPAPTDLIDVHSPRLSAEEIVDAALPTSPSSSDDSQSATTMAVHQLRPTSEVDLWPVVFGRWA